MLVKTILELSEGGSALVTGDLGTGKSAASRILEIRLEPLRDLKVGILTRPQGSLAGFYREMGDIVDVELRPRNRWAGAKALRERWTACLENTHMRAVLIIDEAQQMKPAVLNELRLLQSAHLDSKNLITVILVGDQRLTAILRQRDLIPLSSRIRTRLVFDHAERDELNACLEYLLETAGNTTLMTSQLAGTSLRSRHGQSSCPHHDEPARQILSYLSACPGYPFGMTMDNRFVHELVDDFEHIAILGELKNVYWYKDGAPASDVVDLRIVLALLHVDRVMLGCDVLLHEVADVEGLLQGAVVERLADRQQVILVEWCPACDAAPRCSTPGIGQSLPTRRSPIRRHNPVGKQGTPRGLP